MKITIYGAGYVGLVTAVCFAELGNNVLCVDIDENKIAQLRHGESPIYEPGLTDLLQRNLLANRITFTQDIVAAAQHGLYQFIAVGTPSDSDGSADLRFVLAVAKTIGQHLQQYAIVINKSTAPVGTAEKIREVIKQELQQRNSSLAFDVVSNPEFLKEGHAINDFMEPDRIVIGADNVHAIEKMRQLYASFIDFEHRFIVMDIASAELTKYAANAFLATKISFINEVSQLAERVGADIEQVRIGIGSDPRIGFQFLYAGCGFGGACFPKDVRALKKLAEQYQLDNQILAAVENVNNKQKQMLLTKMQKYFNHQLSNKVIALWGLSFKPNTDDMREASSRILMESLWASGAVVQAYDPIAMQEAKRLYGERDNLKLCQTAEQTLEGADALAIVTEWQEFRDPNFSLIKEKLKYPVIFDGRNLYDPETLATQGFTYYGIGRGVIVE